MQKLLIRTSILTLALLVGFASVASVAADRPPAGSKTAKVHPDALRGPNAIPTGVTDPGYGLFSCQVGLSVGQCYDPFQMRHAYNVDNLISKGFDGTGKTIVIIDAFSHPNIESQLAYFNSFYGLPQMNAGPGTPTFTQVAPDGFGPYDPGWAEEISLDVEWAHAIAPGANIVLELGADNSDVALLSAFNDAVNNNRGDVISMSFGESDTCLGPDLTAAWHQAFVKATKKGITIFASTGDEGAAQPSCDGSSWIKSTSSPASDPLVTGVGGTELHAADYCLVSLGCDPASNPAPGTYQSEIAWNEGPPYGDFQPYFDSTIASGGGFSTVWDKPYYQQGTIRGKMRGEGDVSYNAAVLHGVLTYLNMPGVPVGFYRFGGTSAGSPQWAALTAIADQTVGHNYGFINAALYNMGLIQALGFLKPFHDVTSGTNSALEYDASNNPVDITGYSAGPGWDAVTGLGTPKASDVIAELPWLWSPAQGKAAIAQSQPHSEGKSWNGRHEHRPH
ncbi:MAG TPA: S53 family peptidase [Terriglobales bacterium]|nr:S53 family peptidase [Terriglobales bacterium]